MSAWVEGRHAQMEGWRLAAWAGFAADRWMIGVVLNTESRSLGFGVGPFYVGVGLIG